MTTIKLWRNNRLDQEFEMDVKDIVHAFFISTYAGPDYEGWQLERSVRVFLGSPDGLSATVLEPDIDQIVQLVKKIAAEH